MELTTAYKGELSFRERLARPAFLKLFDNVDERSVFPLRWGRLLNSCYYPVELGLSYSWSGSAHLAYNGMR